MKKIIVFTAIAVMVLNACKKAVEKQPLVADKSLIKVDSLVQTEGVGGYQEFATSIRFDMHENAYPQEITVETNGEALWNIMLIDSASNASFHANIQQGNKISITNFNNYVVEKNKPVVLRLYYGLKSVGNQNWETRSGTVIKSSVTKIVYKQEGVIKTDSLRRPVTNMRVYRSLPQIYVNANNANTKITNGQSFLLYGFRIYCKGPDLGVPQFRFQNNWTNVGNTTLPLSLYLRVYKDGVDVTNLVTFYNDANSATFDILKEGVTNWTMKHSKAPGEFIVNSSYNNGQGSNIEIIATPYNFGALENDQVTVQPLNPPAVPDNFKYLNNLAGILGLFNNSGLNSGAIKSSIWTDRSAGSSHSLTSDDYYPLRIENNVAVTYYSKSQ